MGSSVCGIDLGTTYSCLAYIDETGNPVVAKNSEGSNTTPSVVCFQDDGSVVVGQSAKDDLVFSPDRAVAFVKRLMGETNFAASIDGQDKSPEEISSYILRKVVGDAERTAGMDIKDVVITVPAYFGDPPRTATRNAGEIAGLNVLRIIQEPVAAAVYYGCMKCDGDTNALVYDLGGGTFDVNVISVKKQADGNSIEVVWTDGDKTLGGKDWDAALVQYLKDEFEAQTGIGVFDDEAEEEFQAKAEEAKRQLSSKTATKVSLNIEGEKVKVEVSRDTFNAITQVLLQRTIDLTKDCMEKAASQRGVKVDRILLVGGSTRMVQVEEALSEAFPGLLVEINDPDEAVAKGAALCALDDAVVMVESEEQHGGEAESPCAISEDNLVRNLSLPGVRNKISYATSKSYGVEVMQDGISVISNLIKKNQPIPVDTHEVTVAQVYGTAYSGQSAVEVRIFENDGVDDTVPLEGEPIRTQEFTLGNTCAPEGYPIQVQFNLNEQGLLSVVATEVSTGNVCEFQVEASAGMSSDELQKVKSTAMKVKVE